MSLLEETSPAASIPSTREVSSQDVVSVSGEKTPLQQPGFLFDNHPIPMYIFDRETLAFLAVNDAALSQYGYTRAEFLALTLLDIRPVGEAERLLTSVITMQKT